MIWVYVVVLGFIVGDENRFTVHAPNMAFKTESSCQAWREHDMLRLYESRPNNKSRVISQCVALPFQLQGIKS
jgi:hypothetical protein